VRSLAVLAVIAALAVSFGPAAMAGTTDSHTVTVTVTTINELAITGGNLTLTINSATPGSGLDDAEDSTTCDLGWTTNSGTKKITVATDLAEPSFTLKVTAANVSGGTSAGQVTLSTTAQNFVTGVSQVAGTCDLDYVASAEVTDGTGTDTHTVTYTLTDA
jgi:predicted secreted Zn-dependent protease